MQERRKNQKADIYIQTPSYVFQWSQRIFKVKRNVEVMSDKL